MKPRGRTAATVSASVAAAALVIFVTWISYTIALAQPDSKGVPLLAAAVAFIGTSLATAATVIGFLFKRSFDERTLALMEQERLRKESDQNRLIAETAISAVKLITAEDAGGPASAVQVSAALTVLAKIGEIALAIGMLRELWPGGAVTDTFAVTLCDQALRSGVSDLQTDAAFLLRKNWTRLGAETGELLWPSALTVPLPVDLSQGALDEIDRLLEEWIGKQPLGMTGEFRQSLATEIKTVGRRGIGPARSQGS